MKAERRHQLQSNELARGLETFPEMLKRNATSIMLVITVCVVVFVFMRYRRQAAAARAESLATALQTARNLPPTLRARDGAIGILPSEQIAQERAMFITQTNSAIDTILKDANGDNAQAMKAEALVARGDLNWYLASLQTLPGAATQPSLNLARGRDDYLSAAEAAYRDVLAGYASQTMSAITAQLGLAAIAENRGDWDGARRVYGEIITSKDAPRAFVAVAQERLALLREIEKPVLIGVYPPGASPTTSPTTVPTTIPTTNPSTQPAS